MAGTGDFTLHLLSIIIIFAGSITSLITGIKQLNVYRETKQIQPLIVSVAALFMGIAMLFLVGEQVYFSVLMDNFLGLVFGGIATIWSVFVLVSLDCFVFNVLYLERYKILTGIASVFGGIFIGFWVLDPTKEVVGGEILFGDWWGIGFPITPLVIVLISIPLMILPIAGLLYYSKRYWKEDPLFGKRLLVLGLGGISLATAYAVELIGLDLLISTLLRVGYIIAAILFYWGLFKIKINE